VPETTATAAPAANNSAVRKPGGTSGSGPIPTTTRRLPVPRPVRAAQQRQRPANPSSLGNVGATLFLSPGASTSNLTWANAANATGYRIYRGTTGNFMAGSPAPWQTVAVNAVSDSATPAPIFYYVIRATDGTNESAD